MEKIESKIKIAFFIPSLEEGGAEHNLIKILSNLDKEKYEILLVLGKKKGSLLLRIPKEIPVIALNIYCFPFLFLKLISFLKKEKLDILVSTFPRFNIINILAKEFSKTKTKIVIIEQTIVSELENSAKNFINRAIARFILPFLIKLIYPRADSIISVSGGVAKDLLKFISDSSKLQVIYNPVIEERIYYLSEEPIKHSWFQKAGLPIIISAGRLIKTKDYPTLLLAFSWVFKKIPSRLVILGEGKERKNLERLSIKLGISENVAFLGFQENPYKYLKKSSLFTLSSLREGFSNVIVEAMACGLPIVSTNCQGPVELLEKGKNGILIEKGDEKALAKAIIMLLNNFSLRNKLSEEGKRRAKDFTVEKSINQYDKVFQKIII